MANKKSVKKVTKKPTTKKVTKKVTKTTTKKVVKPAAKKTVKPTVKKTVKPEEKKVVKEEVKLVKEEVVEETSKRSKKVLIVGLLYLLCSFVWLIGGISKILVKESGILDILVGVFLIVISIIYFVRFAKNKELK